MNEEEQVKLLELVKKLNIEESGQDLVEYALVLTAVGGAVFAASTTLAGDLTTAMGGLAANITAWGL
jgi:Flp pilus assembly pilin Flp